MKNSNVTTKVRCTDCRHFAYQRYCDVGDTRIKDASRTRRCSAWLSNATVDAGDGLRMIFDMQQCLAAAVLDGQFTRILMVWAQGQSGILSSPYRLYLLLPDRLAVIDADRPYGWMPVYEPLAMMMGVEPVAAYWANPGE